MEEWLRAFIRADAAITARIAARVDWGIRSQGSPLPGIALFVITDAPAVTMTGPGKWSDARVQADTWARTAGEAIIIGRLLQNRLHGARVTDAGKKRRVFVIDRGTDQDADDTGPLHRTRLDLRVIYQL